MSIPKGKHWAIIETYSETVPGDQRSRDFPGHGYPEHVEERIRYRPFSTREAMLVELRKTLPHRVATVRGIEVSETYAVKLVADTEPEVQ